ncbi:polysaccharide pyruvyl transferase family protein [Chryseobacterium sp. RLHN22]|uniref:polysaccharide pyruvyl transferase family protein n=1 Tax=Chryseobacterium sp. RLHN22 TaxID=3437885 RepID=UPI003D9B2F0D
MAKKIVITHAFGPDNRGDHELLEKLIKIIYKKYGNETQISIFSSFPEKSEEVFDNPKIKFYKSFISLAGKEKSILNLIKLFLLAIGLLVYYFLGIKWFIPKNTKLKLATINNADFIFYCPGGYLYSNKQSYYANIFNGFLLRKSKAIIYFSPMSIGPFYSDFDKSLTKKLIRNKDIVFARESYTYNLCKDLEIKNIYLTTDLAWYESKYEKFNQDLKWENKFVITIIDWDYNDLGNQEFYKKRYISEIIQCCTRLFKISGQKVVLYNQVGTGKGETNDEKLIKRILNEIPEYVSFDYEELVPEVLKSRLHYCNGLIASRFHSALFAIQAECPFIALSYQPKAEYILKDLNLAEFSRKISEFDGVNTANKLIEISNNKNEYVKKIEKAKEYCAISIEKNFINKL